MASTYSDLKIQLMTTGENSGTWGDVTNINLGTAIEEAIVGSADVAFSSADVTLTLANTNETQTARNLRLNLTGTSGGNRNLIVPAIEKVYIINNGLANQVTVKNATGTGVVVPAGKTMYVYNNGTNVVDAITHLTSLTTGALTSTSTTTLNGTTIPASATLTKTTDKLNVFAATTSAELAGVITNETGTGSLVFAGSPALTGTPTAPTAAAGTNTTQLATTAHVFAERTNTATLTNKTLTSPVINTPTGIVKADVGLGNVDNTSDATKNSATATLTNKTISVGNNTLSGIAASSFVLSNASGNIDGAAAQKAIPSGVVVGTTDTQTLTNKTITGSFTGPLTGNASTATALQTARTIGGVSFDGTANIDLPGVNATGNQNTTGSAASLTTARTINGTSFNGTANITTATWGTARTINGVSINGSTNYVVEPYVENDDTTNATRYLTFVDSSTAGYQRLNEDADLTYNPGTNVLTAGTFSGALSGNATTATTLQTARTINGVSFNGSANITVTANTTNTLTRGTYLTGNNFNGSAATTWAVDATTTNTASKVVARDASGNFSAGTITAALNGNASTATSATTATDATNTTNVALTTSSTASAFKVPFANTTVSTTGNYGLLQDSEATFTYNPSTNVLTAGTFSGALSGNATTATTLQTARTINGTSFNGSANITTANWGTARTLWGQSVNGSANITAPLLPAAGSVSAPAFSTSGDTNTGMFFPAADTIAFTEGGVEAMRISSTGNVGIGTNSPSAQFQTTGSVFLASAGTGAIFVPNGSGLWMNGFASFGAGVISDSAGSAILLQTSGLERMRITSAGNVGIGTSSPSRRLEVHTANGTETSFLLNQSGVGAATLFVPASQNALGFGVFDGISSVTERMRIDTSGTLILNQGQIQFPATQNPSSNANTLDDYEEGTWTPVDASGAGLSFTDNTGTYRKIGGLVVCSYRLKYPSTVNASSALIGGLPFNNAVGFPTGYTGYNSGLGAVVNHRLSSATSFYVSNAATGADISNSSISTLELQGTFIYFAV
jgi:hypothetical protein